MLCKRNETKDATESEDRSAKTQQRPAMTKTPSMKPAPKETENKKKPKFTLSPRLSTQTLIVLRTGQSGFWAQHTIKRKLVPRFSHSRMRASSLQMLRATSPAGSARLS